MLNKGGNIIAGKQFTDLTKASALKDSDIIAVHDGNGLKSVTIEQLHASTYNNAGAHNSIFRGKFLGERVTDEQYSCIADGSFKNLFIGDYWTIGDVNYRIAGFDYYYRCGDTDFNQHHAVIVPDVPLYSYKMNDTDTTNGGYVGSKMHTEGLEQAKRTIKSAFHNHVAKHRIILTNAVSNGHPSSATWLDSEVDLMSENMVYGGRQFSPMNYGTDIPANYTVERGQLPLFHLAPNFIHANRHSWCWLRDIVSATSFADTGYDGVANHANSGSSAGVRPFFCIY